MRTSLQHSAKWAALSLVVLTVAARPAAAQDLFNNTNVYGVANGPRNPTVFTLRANARITQLVTYHWNGGRGAAPGSIGLRNQNGQPVGTFAAAGTSGQGGAPNVNWIANVNLNLPAGTYTVVDSNPATWAQNQQSQSAGFAIVRGSLVTGTTQTTGTSVPYNGNCHGAGCTHPDFRSFGGNGPFGVGTPRSVHRAFNPSAFYWVYYLPPYTAVSTLQRQCASANGQFMLLDDEPWYYYFIGQYTRFGCSH